MCVCVCVCVFHYAYNVHIVYIIYISHNLYKNRQKDRQAGRPEQTDQSYNA